MPSLLLPDRKPFNLSAEHFLLINLHFNIISAESFHEKADTSFSMAAYYLGKAHERSPRNVSLVSSNKQAYLRSPSPLPKVFSVLS